MTEGTVWHSGLSEWVVDWLDSRDYAYETRQATGVTSSGGTDILLKYPAIPIASRPFRTT